MDYEDIVRLNVLMTAGIGGKFNWLPENVQRQVDAAISIVRKGVDQDLIRSLESRTALGYYVFHAFQTDPDCKAKEIFHKLASVHVESSQYMKMSAYQSMLTTTVNALKKSDFGAEGFVRVLLKQSMGLDHSGIIRLLGVGSRLDRKTSEHEDVAQGLILKELVELEGGKELLIKHVTKPALGKLVLKYGLSGLEGAISRKDAGHLLSDRLGL